MIQLLRFFFRSLSRFLLSLRYRVRVEGKTPRTQHHKTLLLPNHPGYIDPALVSSFLGDGIDPRPMVFTDTYRNPLLYPLMRLMHALEIPKLQQHSQGAREQTQAVVDAVVEGLNRGDNFLIYPSGRLQREGTEVIGAASAVSEILQRVPDANIILVQTKGVWGSRFSFAQTGELPPLTQTLIRSVKDLLLNLLFFMPRREITITMQPIERDQLPELKRETLNPWLEEWYNRDNPSEPTWVPYHFLSTQQSFDFPKRATLSLDAAQDVPNTTQEGVIQILEEKLNRPLEQEERAYTATLDQIGLDSLDRMEVALEIERRFGFQSAEVPENLGGLMLLAHGALASASTEAKPAPETWTESLQDSSPAQVEGNTITEAFLRQAMLQPKAAAVADDLSGTLTYEKTLIASLLFARRFREYEGEAVGILLPASVAADLAYLGLLYAGKTPVLLNWTTGQANLNSTMEKMQIRHVITSRKFLDRIGADLSASQVEALEDLRAGISKWEGLRLLLGFRCFGRRGLGKFHYPLASDTAAVLFTSGSEKAPKAVPLSHQNILANVRAGARALQLKGNDKVLGFLPPFHSFGLSGNMILPLTTGMAVVHHPDPTDARGLAAKLASYRATSLFSTPTFLSYILNAAKPEDLTSLRLAVTGAEACPTSVAEKCQAMAPQAEILEGYGITECSPVVAVGRPGQAKPGTIGQPLDNVETLVVDPDSHQPLASGQTGMLLVRGESIFSGYLAHEGDQPFCQANGERWYVTGDLVSQTADGTLTFRGRLKRFLKAGGEMISLPALEAPFATAYPPNEEGPQVAVEGIETPEGRRIALFTTTDLDLRTANRLLAEHGFQGIMRLDDVRRQTSLPVLGTGKIDYKQLRAELTEETETTTR